MIKEVIWLDEAEGAEQIGYKAKNLSILRRHGYNVPDGYIITSNLYKKYTTFLRAGIIDNLCSRTITLRDINALSKKVQASFMKIDFMEEDKITLLEKYHQLGTLAAVRSSSTMEDQSGLSFAGQHDSFLDVSEEGLFEAVKKCWASLYSSRAIAYRIKKGVREDPAMAVIVQEFVKPYAKGTMFTANPVNGADEIIIEYQADLCHRDSGTNKITVKKVSDTKVPDFVEPLIKTAESISELFKGPQDLEWIVDSKKIIYFLQTRPLFISAKS